MEDIKTLHFLSLDDDNDICGEDRSFVRTEAGTWFETNGYLGDQYERIDDEVMALKLEALFWQSMYDNK